MVPSLEGSSVDNLDASEFIEWMRVQGTTTISGGWSRNSRAFARQRDFHCLAVAAVISGVEIDLFRRRA